MANNDPTLLMAGDGPRDAAADPTGRLARTIGDFRIAGRVGSGAMGDVYLATHRTTGAEAAIKVVSPHLANEEGFAKRFTREIEALKQLDHPNVARAIAYGLHDARPWLAMEYVRGPNLAEIQRDQGALREEIALRLAIQIAHGLDHVHAAAGLIHRDIKPSNILVAVALGPDGVTRDGEHQAKIIDFGLAKRAGEAGDAGITQPGSVVGTPSYMSPEQIRGDPQIDHRTDIYSLGGTLYRMLTDRSPYEGSSVAVVLAGHLTGPVPDPGERVPGLHPLTRQLVLTAMAKAVADRHPSYAVFIAEAERALETIRARGGRAGAEVPPLRVPGVQARPATLPVIDDDDPFAEPDDDNTTNYVPGRAVRKRPDAFSELDAAHEREMRPAPTEPASEALRQAHSTRIVAKRIDGETTRIEARPLRVPKRRPGEQSAALRGVPDVSSPRPWIALAICLAALLLFLCIH